MPSLIAVDLGKWTSGVAVFDQSNRLVRAFEITIPRGPNPAGRMAEAIITEVGIEHPFVVEKMKDYEGKAGRAGDLEQLREVPKELRARGARVHERTAASWKGNVPKHVTHARALDLLDEVEVENIDDAGDKEIMDAVALGLVFLGRARRGVVRPK